MTIKEIAKLSGYGIGTVSRVLNHNPNVSERAREAIEEVIQTYHFQPNTNARHLKLQANTGIAMIVKGTQNMLFAEIIEIIQQEIERKGYPTFINYIDQDADEVEEAVRVCAERKPLGIIFFGAAYLEARADVVDRLGIPSIILTDSAATFGASNLSSIGINDTLAASYMMDYLFQMGHTRIGIIGGNPKLSHPTERRLEGIQLSYFRKGMTFDPKKQYVYSRFSMEGGYEAANSLMEQYPDMTAIFAMSDLMAVGAMRAIFDSNRRVPDDISVVGFDGIKLSKYVHPKLTTIRQNAEKIADRGMEVLLNCIANKTGGIHEIVPFEFQKGSSVKNLAE